MAGDPLEEAMLIFADGSSKGRAAYLVNGEGHVVQTSAQRVELLAVPIVFQPFAFNEYIDSQYIFNALQVLEV